MTTRVELEAIAARAIPTQGASDVVAVVDVGEGGRLSNGYPSGIGVVTRYGVCWFDGLARSAPIAWFDRSVDAHRLIDLLKTGSVPRSGPHSGTVVGSLGGRHQVYGEGPGPGHRQRRRASCGRCCRAGPRPDAVASALEPDLEPAGRAIQHAPLAPVSPGYCKACGRSLHGLPPSPQIRQTCNDACRQAYRRGHRAASPAVVPLSEIYRVSQLAGPPPRRVRDVGPAEFI